MRSIILLLVLLRVAFSRDFRLILTEEDPPPVYLGNLANITGLSQTISKREQDSLRYTFVSRSDKLDQKFQLDEISGDLTTVEAIDREEICSFVKECRFKLDVAVQSLESAFFGRYTLNIDILDINDNDPKFTVDSFHIDVREDMQIGTSFNLPSATDKDGDPVYSSLSYELSTTSIPFDLMVKNNLPVLVLVSAIDRETDESYDTVIIAYDNVDKTRSGTLSVSINIKDSNDNNPVFEQKSFETRIPETLQVNSTILQVLASDIDLAENGRIKYFLSKENSFKVKTYFQIGLLSGGLYVTKSLRSEGGKTFLIRVQACDSGDPPLCTDVNVTVYISDTENDAPKINSQLLFSKDGAASVKESSPFGRVVALVSVDDDDSGLNGETICSMEDEYFQLQKLQPKEYKVFVRRTLNREVMPKHEVFITCQDLGTPSLKSTSSFTVVVEDENDSEPVFEREIYTFVVKENSTLPTYIGRVSAIDKDAGDNGDIVYEIDTNNVGNEFSINSTGHIFAITTLDYEWKPQVVFNVLASDKGENPLTSMAAVIVNITDINDNPPVFEKSVFTFRILENEPLLFSPGCVSATDRDSGFNGNLTFTSPNHEENAAVPFVVSSVGCLTLVEKLDYEKIKSYELRIVASDNGVPVLKSSVFVVVSVIDENDNKPVIIFPVQKNNTIIIGHKTVPRSEIAVVQAYDADSGENGKMIFSITSQNGSDLFEIDATTGHISTTREIESNERQIYELNILVSDLGTPKLKAESVLKVDVRELPEVELELANRFKNLKIVSVLVCVTVLLSLSVMTILCLIKYMDKRRKEVKITTPPKSNERPSRSRDFDEITQLPNYSNLNTSDQRVYYNIPPSSEFTTKPHVDTSTVARQNRINDVIVSSRDPNVKAGPKQEKRTMKVYRRSKHTPQMDGCHKQEVDIDVDLDASVIDILRRHNQVVRSVKATKTQKRQIAADLFDRHSSEWRSYSHETLGSDSGVGGSDVELAVHPVYTIPV